MIAAATLATRRHNAFLSRYGKGCITTVSAAPKVMLLLSASDIASHVNRGAYAENYTAWGVHAAQLPALYCTVDIVAAIR